MPPSPAMTAIWHSLDRQGSPPWGNLFFFFFYSPQSRQRTRELVLYTFFLLIREEQHMGRETTAPASRSTDPRTPQPLNSISFSNYFLPMLEVSEGQRECLLRPINCQCISKSVQAPAKDSVIRCCLKEKKLCGVSTLQSSPALHFSNVTSGRSGLERRRNYSDIRPAIFQGSIMFRGPLFLLSELKKPQLHIHQDKSRASINERGGFAGNQGVLYIANGKREFV